MRWRLTAQHHGSFGERMGQCQFQRMQGNTRHARRAAGSVLHISVDRMTCCGKLRSYLMEAPTLWTDLDQCVAVPLSYGVDV